MIEEQYIDRIKHTYSHYRTNDDELTYARTLSESAERIEVKTHDAATTVDVYTDQGVTHFGTFRADYIGHASRTLVQLFEHFGVRLPLEFVVAHQTFIIYLGKLVAAGDREYPLGRRQDHDELVEAIPSDWQMAPAVLDVLAELTRRYDTHPVEILESATGLLYSLLDLANEYQMDPDEIVQTVTTLVAQTHSDSDTERAAAEWATGEEETEIPTPS